MSCICEQVANMRFFICSGEWVYEGKEKENEMDQHSIRHNDTQSSKR